MKRTALAAATHAVLLLALLASTSEAQDRLKTMPGYERFTKMSRDSADAVKPGTLAVTWLDGGKAFQYSKDGKRWHFDIAEGKAVEADASKPAPAAKAPQGEGTGRRFFGGGNRPERGRQYTSAMSPDGKLKAFYRDHNLWLSETNGANERAITTEGSAAKRLKLGTASWVYGEELDQLTAMWWSPDSKRVAFYRFDESQVRDFYLALGQTRINSSLDTEPYVKAGATNPVVDILIHDLESKKTLTVDARDGKPFDNSVVGHYLYNVSWTQDGKELLFHRTNRRQNVMEFTAADSATGKCRVVVREEWPASWTENSPAIRWLKDGKRFIWLSERNGWKNFYLHHLDGRLLAALTTHEFEVANIVRVDEDANLLHYLARSGDNHMKLQLHRVALDGTGERRLTDPAWHHTVDLAPDARHFMDTIQTHDTPPSTRLVDADGKVLAELAKSDTTKFEKLGLKRVELLKFKSADGTNDLHGLLHFPSNFDPAKKYPLLVTVYAGPATSAARETFATPNSLTEFGFLVASFDSRSANGRGKRFLDAIYMKLGVPEIDDQAAGVRSLWSRPYVNKERVGIFGTSYGGTASALCLVRHPDAFAAACASSSVTDFRHYDSIYTERFMWIPQENAAGYDGGSVMKHVNNLKGRLMLFYGTADNNVHPANTMQLVQALQRAGKSFDLQLGPDIGHAGLNRDRMMEFFIENLVMR